MSGGWQEKFYALGGLVRLIFFGSVVLSSGVIPTVLTPDSHGCVDVAVRRKFREYRRPRNYYRYEDLSPIPAGDNTVFVIQLPFDIFAKSSAPI